MGTQLCAPRVSCAPKVEVRNETRAPSGLLTRALNDGVIDRALVEREARLRRVIASGPREGRRVPTNRTLICLGSA